MSTLAATNLKHASSASNNIVLDSSGNTSVSGAITVTGAATFNGTLVPASSFLRNRIINGNFDFWQRGTSFSSSSVNEYSADRFRTEGFNLTTTISRQSFTANQTDVPGYPTYYCRVATSATVAVGQYWAFQQRVESPQNLAGYEQVTLSFWARASSGTVAANTFSYGGSSGRTNNPSLTTTWQRLTHTWTLSGPASGYVEIYLMYLAAGTTATSVDIALVQLEVGTAATPFERRQFGQELALCQRYFQSAGSGAFGSFDGSTATTIQITEKLMPTMRTTPTASIRSGVNAAFRSAGADFTATSPALANFSANTNAIGEGIAFWTQVTGFTGGTGNAVVTSRNQVSTNGGAFINLSAEL